MIWLINKWVHVKDGEVVRWWFQFGSNRPIWAILAGLILIVLAAWWAYRPSVSGAMETPRPGMPPGRGLPAWKRWTMAVLRTVALLLLADILLEPMLGYDRTLAEKPTLAILLDDTQSMSIRDKRLTPADQLAAARPLGKAKYGRSAPSGSLGDQGNPARSELLAAAWKNGDLDLQNQLARRYNLRVYRFTNETAELATSRPDGPFRIDAALAKLAFASPVTDIGQAVRRAVADLRTGATAGIVMMTDGQTNRGDGLPDVAKLAASANMPVFPVGLGVRETKDLQMAAFLCEDVVFINDEVQVVGLLRQRGYTDETVAVELLRENEVIASTHVRLADTEHGDQQFQLKFKPTVKGEANYRLRVENRPDELIADNNWKDKRIKVIDEAIKLLVVEESPRWDFRCLHASMLRDKRVKLSVWVREADGVELSAAGMPEYLAKFPDKREDLFKYDVIILGDVPASAFSKEQLKLLEEFVSANGGGLCFAAGPRYNPASYKNTNLEPLVPVVFAVQPEPSAEMELFNPLVQPFHLEITREGLASAVCSLAETDGANASVWRRLPPFYWYFPATRLRPGATALAWHAEQRSREGRVPMIAHQYYGKGATFYVGLDSTWRWQDRVGPKKYFDRFWGQVVNFLSMAHLLGGSKRVQITLDSKTYSVGEQVHVSARVLDKTYQPLGADVSEVTARIGPNDQETVDVPLQRVPTQPGMFTGQYQAPATLGDYAVAIKGEESEGKAAFRVQMPQLEFDKPALAEDELRQLADATRGKYFDLADLDGLPDAINAARPLRTVPGQTPLWDTWTMLVAAVVLLGAEWLIRKRADLA